MPNANQDKGERKYTAHDLFEVAKEESRNHYTILHYILNKNSHPLPRGVDFDKLFDELQDYERYLLDWIN